MLHRAASNAYSWWWASHIRTKQSKWLDNNLQEMDEKVQYMLKLIDEDGDSFAKRAESYYRKRPELIGFVEEFYRAYRALAERYDHISGELQNANHTIATVFPEQIQFAMEEEDDTGSPKVSARQVDASKIPKDLPEVPKINIPNFLKNLKKEKISPVKPPKKVQSKKTSTATSSHLNKDEAIEEIDKLQKGILALQTEKEFVKSSYENRLTKYWEIEKAITDMQEKVCGLQDEFNVGTLIEDHEARTLMASTALKSCQETLVQLQEKQERSNEEARLEYERIKDARKKLMALKDKYLQDQTDQILSEGSTLKLLEQEVQNVQEEMLDAESVREKIREHFEMNSSTNLTVPEMAEKIDELVTKVISLETAVSSQTALIDRLRSETDGLQEHLRSLEEDKVAMLQDSNKLNEKLRDLEGELNTVQELNRNVENQNNNLQTHFTEAHCNLDHLSEKLKSVKPLDEEIEIIGSSKEELDVLVNAEPHKEHEEPEEMIIISEDASNIKEEVDVLVNVESRKEHEEPEGTVILSEDAINRKEEATGIEEVQAVQDPSLHVNDQAEAPTLHVNDQAEGPSLYVGDQAEAPTLHVKKEEAPSSHVSDQPEAPTLHINQKEEAPSLHVSDQPEAPTLHINKEEEAPRSHVSDQAQSPAEPNSSINDADVFEMSLEIMQRDDVEKQDSSQKDDKVLDSEQQEKLIEEDDDEPNWKQLYLSGLEDRERILLAEYTSILRKYKETRKQLSELQIKNHDSQFEAMVQLRELKSAIAIKDEEIKSLRQKLKFLQESDNSQQEKAHETENSQQEKAVDSENSQQEKAHNMLEEGFTFQTSSGTTVNFEHLQASNLQDRNAEERASSVSSTADRASDIIPTKVEEGDEVKMVPIVEHHTVSSLEEKFRRDIDELLEQNLEFWLRFSGSFHQIQTFQTSIEDLQGEYMKLKENQNQEDSTSSKHGSSLQSNARPIYKHLREIQTDLTVWSEKNMLLKDELKYRLASLRSIYDEITRSSKTSSDAEVEFTSYQAAKFQGEVLNMQQENNKVADELQAGLEHVKGLQVEIDKTLVQMNDELKLSGSKNHHHHVIHSLSRTRIPLRSFLFGAKKRQKPSFFACINPALQKQYSDLQGHVPR